MRLSRVPRPSAALVISVIALFVSLGGVGYAAATIGSKQIKNGSVSSTDLKNNSVSSTDIKNGTVVTKDINAKTRASLKGAAGPQGANGANGANGADGADGSARAYARVDGQNTLFTPGTTKGLGGATITNGGVPSTGKYCITGLPFAPQNVTVANTIVGGAGAIFVKADIGTGSVLTGCPANTQVSFLLKDTGSNNADGSFYFALN